MKALSLTFALLLSVAPCYADESAEDAKFITDSGEIVTDTPPLLQGGVVQLFGASPETFAVTDTPKPPQGDPKEADATLLETVRQWWRSLWD